VEYEEIPEYVEGIMESVRQLDTFIQSEIDSGIPEGRIVLGGFSQGGAISLITGLGGSQLRGASDTKAGWKLGGVVCLGGWLPIRETLVRETFQT
jgi:predicted esterase